MFADLPEVAIASGIRRGRRPKDGYQRGLFLLSNTNAVECEDLYRFSIEIVRGLTVVVPYKRANIYLILTRYLSKLAYRNVIEFGVWKGGNALFMALVLKEIAPEATVYALDTFEGMPETNHTIDAHKIGDFRDTSIDALRAKIDELGLTNIVPVKGLFQETFPILAQNKNFGLAHIDADIYSACKYAQDAVWPHMTRGGYVIYDDADYPNCLGATEAVEELIQERKVHCEQIWPHFVFRTGLE